MQIRRCFFKILSLIPFVKVSQAQAAVIGHEIMGDTAIQWSWNVADIIYNTRAFSPRSERMRKDLVEASYKILRQYYDPGMSWDRYWHCITERIKELQKEEIKRFEDSQVDLSRRSYFQIEEREENSNEMPYRSIESLFDVNRADA